MSEITEHTKFRTSIGAAIALLGIVAAGALAWASVNGDVANAQRTLSVHERRLDSLESKISADHDLLLEIRGDVKALRNERQSK